MLTFAGDKNRPRSVLTFAGDRNSIVFDVVNSSLKSLFEGVSENTFRCLIQKKENVCYKNNLSK